MSFDLGLWCIFWAWFDFYVLFLCYNSSAPSCAPFVFHWSQESACWSVALTSLATWHNFLRALHQGFNLGETPPQSASRAWFVSCWVGQRLHWKRKGQSLKERWARAGNVRCLVYWRTKHWAWFAQRREEPRRLNVWWEEKPSHKCIWKF